MQFAQKIYKALANTFAAFPDFSIRKRPVVFTLLNEGQGRLMAVLVALVLGPMVCAPLAHGANEPYSEAGSGWVTISADLGPVVPKGPFSNEVCAAYDRILCKSYTWLDVCTNAGANPVPAASFGSFYGAPASCVLHQVEGPAGGHEGRVTDATNGVFQYCFHGAVVQSNGDCLCPAPKHWGELGGRNQCVDSCPVGQTPNEQNVCSSAPPVKNKGPVCPNCGKPINPGTGNEYELQVFLPRTQPNAVSVDAFYNSPTIDEGSAAYTGMFGKGWTSGLDRQIRLIAGDAANGYAASAVSVQRADGKAYSFQAPSTSTPVNGAILWTTTNDITDKLERLVDGSANTIGWRYTESAAEDVEIYDADGRLLSVTSRQGLTEKYAYADGLGGTLYAASSGAGASPLGYVAPACNGPASWAYQVNTANALVTEIPVGGRLLCVSDPFGRQVNVRFNSNAQLIAFADYAGSIYGFEYDGPTGGCNTPGDGGCAKGNLTKVTFPDSTTRLYSYNESSLINGGGACSGLTAAGSGLGPFPNHMTGLTDENGNRFNTWSYDCLGRAASSELAGGVEKVTLAYGSPAAGQTTVTHYSGTPLVPATTARVYGFTNIQGLVKNTGMKDPATNLPAPCIECGDFASREYDANGNLSSTVDWNGNRTCIFYDLGLIGPSRNLENRRVEGLPSSASCAAYVGDTPSLSGVQRMTTTVWTASFRLPLGTSEPLRTTNYSYDLGGNLTTKTVQPNLDASGAVQGFDLNLGAPRIWNYTYNANGRVLTADGPRTDVSDVTTYTYYDNADPDPGKRGNMSMVADALGHTTHITAYNAYGQPLTVVDPNGLTTELTYDSRQRLVSRSVGGEVTSYTYDGTGQLTQVTMPDLSAVTYIHDTAHRLTSVQDNLGNKIAYTLDLRGNRVKEDVYDPSNTLAQTRSRVYDALNRLRQDIGAQSQTTQYAYDAQGNLATVTDPLSHVTTNAYDALNRLASMTQPVPAAGASAPVISYAYNGLDQLAQVTDPRNLITSYAYNGVGNLNTQVSPDTGITNNTYDDAGNIRTSTDAKHQVAAYTYDALNRVASVTYNQATGTQLKTITYAYDQGANGIGRLTTVTEKAASTATLQTAQYAYDTRGHLIQETRTLTGNAAPYVTSYNYDAATGRLLGMTYPTGRTLSYSYDAVGRVSQVGTTAPSGQTQLLVFGITYQPFGGIKAYTLGNNRTITRGYDQDGRISSYTLGGTSFTVGYDSSSRITSLLDTVNAANSTSYGYDNLDRLTSASVPATSYSYSYDATGNRLSRTAGAATDLTTVSTTSNRISQVAGSGTRAFSYDANGSTTNDGNNTYGYDARGRMVSATNGAGTASYQVSANGQRVRKTSWLGDTVFHYDAQGKLIAETTTAGVVKKEYLYLLDILVAVNAQ